MSSVFVKTYYYSISLIKNPLVFTLKPTFPSKWNPYMTLLNAKSVAICLLFSSVNLLCDRSKWMSSGWGLDITLHIALVHS